MGPHKGCSSHACMKRLVSEEVIMCASPMTYGRPVFSACVSSITNERLWYSAAWRTEKRTRACAHPGVGTSSGRASDAAYTPAALSSYRLQWGSAAKMHREVAGDGGLTMSTSQVMDSGLGRKNMATKRLLVVAKRAPIHMLIEQYTSKSFHIEAISGLVLASGME